MTHQGEIKRLRQDVEALKLEVEIFIRDEKERKKRHLHDVEKCQQKLNAMTIKVKNLEEKCHEFFSFY